MIKITLNDAGLNLLDSIIYFNDADSWAQKNCKSYKGCTVTEVSDFSYAIDIITTYEFLDEADANWFQLKWK